MCIAILNKKEKINKQVLKTCESNNPDGMGMAWIERDKKTGADIVRLHHQMKDFESFYKKYSYHRSRTDKPIMLHFRISTGGLLNTANCHPFYVRAGKLAFMHNGIISAYSYKKSDKTDTIHFNNCILKQLPTDFLDNHAIRELIAEVIGYSKLVFLDSTGRFDIINEDMGDWFGDTWYSNDSHSYCKRKYTSLGAYNSWSDYEDAYADTVASSSDISSTRGTVEQGGKYVPAGETERKKKGLPYTFWANETTSKGTKRTQKYLYDPVAKKMYPVKPSFETSKLTDVGMIKCDSCQCAFNLEDVRYHSSEKLNMCSDCEEYYNSIVESHKKTEAKKSSKGKKKAASKK